MEEVSQKNDHVWQQLQRATKRQVESQCSGVVGALVWGSNVTIGNVKKGPGKGVSSDRGREVQLEALWHAGSWSCETCSKEGSGSWWVGGV